MATYFDTININLLHYLYIIVIIPNTLMHVLYIFNIGTCII